METTHKVTQRVNWVTVAIAFACFLVGLVVIFASTQTDWWNGHTTWQTFSRDLGSLIFMTSALTLVWEFLNRRAFLDEIIAKTNLSANIATAGLSFVSSAFNDDEIEWKRYFYETQKLTMFAGYARTWRNTNLTRIEELLTRGGSLTVYLPDPDKPYLVAELARRYNSPEATVRERINESAVDFISLQPAEGNGKVEVRFVDATPQYSFYVFDRMAVLALYDHNPAKRAPVPTFICTDNGSVYNFIKKDIECLSGISRVYTSVADPA